MRYGLNPLVLAVAIIAVGACSRSDGAEVKTPDAPVGSGAVMTVADTTVSSTFDATGVAEPFAQATLSTKLMGSVTAVLAREGDRVAAGQPLVRIDARDLAAKQSQVSAGIAEAEAVHRDAQVQAARIRALYADSAATRAQLDAAETGLARAEASVRQAHAGASELAAVAGYAVVRAPFAGIVTQRFVDPGAFAAPGAPLVSVQDSRKLRVTATITPQAARGLRRGATIPVTIENASTAAIIEGVVPAPAGNVYTINAIVDNQSGSLMSGSAATLAVPQGMRKTILVPASAIRREGDLTGVMLRGAAGDELRWVRLGPVTGAHVEVIGGLRAGDRVVLHMVTPTHLSSANEGR